MELTISITQILTVCAGIITLSGAGSVIYKLISVSRKPEDTQNKRITKLEERVAKHDEMLSRDKEKLEMIENGNRTSQRALLALLSHGIDGNEIDSMKKAKAELENFLIDR